MDYFIVASVAFVAALLTFFSGFGLATLLMPCLVLFMPIHEAIAATAVVHLLNNLFKLALMRLNMDLGVVIKFGLPALLFAALGALALNALSTHEIKLTFDLFSQDVHTSLLKVIIGVMILVFVFIDWIPLLNKIRWRSSHLVIGGALSGFFGGLSGHQGALRSIFLIQLIKDKHRFIATGVTIACLVDIARLAIYSHVQGWYALKGLDAMLVTAILSAFLGSLLGKKLLHKVTYRQVKIMVSLLLVGVGMGLMLGKL